MKRGGAELPTPNGRVSNEPLTRCHPASDYAKYQPPWLPSPDTLCAHQRHESAIGSYFILLNLYGGDTSVQLCPPQFHSSPIKAYASRGGGWVAHYVLRKALTLPNTLTVCQTRPYSVKGKFYSTPKCAMFSIFELLYVVHQIIFPRNFVDAVQKNFPLSVQLILTLLMYSRLITPLLGTFPILENYHNLLLII